MANKTWQKVEGPPVIFTLANAGPMSWLMGTNEGLWHYHSGACRIVSEALRNATITAVAAAPKFPRHNLILVGSVDGIARSIDNGATWSSATMTQPSQVAQIVFSPNFENDSIVFAATLEDGVLRSTDQGVRWSSWNFGLLDLETLALALSPTFAEDDTVLVATGTGVFRSINGGRAWRELLYAGEGAQAEEAMPPTGVVMARDTWVVSTESKGLFYSHDAGETWGKRTAFRSGQTNTIAVAPDRTTLLLATPNAIALSKDAGATWDRVAKPPDNVISLGLDTDGTILCGTQEEGLWIYK
jgi:photosystem II stability/assembly factor-like uncharacterized protein